MEAEKMVGIDTDAENRYLWFWVSFKLRCWRWHSGIFTIVQKRRSAVISGFGKQLPSSILPVPLLTSCSAEAGQVGDASRWRNRALPDAAQYTCTYQASVCARWKRLTRATGKMGHRACKDCGRFHQKQANLSPYWQPQRPKANSLRLAPAPGTQPCGSRSPAEKEAAK